ncbi:cytochrome c biogenesis heme-transporting ATPase CcmA [Spongiibacter sp. KMU-166]|uniref:Cytochrome c biogenesis heme-transporting ATPase CcmA n=1 Tax=Spongiibacter thalassae TaxID=2721624 RepID=A0ABX1GCU7_9GAMM|nr:cytochrome c biogenesis heme-transporting ATPase CcmA [Spongiibacter thalassae]NKI16963.1 cytochrome c biogenesis heme-transporting ATPase CcmA [Spongiibacter thalassae]
MATALEIRHLYSERDERVLFADLSINLRPGEILQLAGPNGSGKTSLLRILAGLSSRYEGDIDWCGQPLRHQWVDYRQRMLYFSHGSGIKPQLTAVENLRWSCAMRGQAVTDGEIYAALDRVGLGGFGQQACYTLSAGQQRRVNLARLFCIDACFWLLDEPFTAIDLAGVAEIEHWIAEFAEGGGMVMLTTHHPLAIDRPVIRVDLGGGIS